MNISNVNQQRHAQRQWTTTMINQRVNSANNLDINTVINPVINSAAEQADRISSRALFACLLREIAEPAGTVNHQDGYVTIRLPCTGHQLRTRVVVGTSLAPRFVGDIELVNDLHVSMLSAVQLAKLTSDELTRSSGVVNIEFEEQVVDSCDGLTQLISERAVNKPLTDQHLDSEQSLVAGHPRHPTPKSRQGHWQTWLQYAPEARKAFPLLLLAIDNDLLHIESAQVRDGIDMSRVVSSLLPNTYELNSTKSLLPVHPWQWSLFESNSILQSHLRDGSIELLQSNGTPVVPTSSVRTVHVPDVDVFLKFSLNVRLTNCLRKIAWYELTSAVVLNDVVLPRLAQINLRYPCTFLSEPECRTLKLPNSEEGAHDVNLFEGFGVIMRAGLCSHTLPGVTALVAGSLVEVFGKRYLPTDAHTALQWWQKYVELLLPPVLLAYVKDGVVLEPHLQNVIVGINEQGLPAQIIFRDLEGVKLAQGKQAHRTLPPLPVEVIASMVYDSQRAWQRVAYCLFVNNLAEIASALIESCPEIADDVWSVVSEQLNEFIHKHGATSHLQSFIEGEALPAKANLLLRWSRQADRAAEYISVPNPFISSKLHAKIDDIAS